ncbi:MAG: hypothetical protein QM778_12990 [Myxococcales bacterium]
MSLERRAGARAQSWRALLGCALLGTWLAVFAPRVHAQGNASEPDLAPGEQLTEAVDPTRLDVARLPPEAIEVTRDLYAHGLFLEAQAGALAFVGDANVVSTPGPRFGVALGYEVFSWLSPLLLLEGSMHRTDNRGPPAPSAYELIGGALGARLNIPFNARAALWVSGLVGVNWSSRDVLRALGFTDAFKLGINYGGELGFDWHLKSRHHSLGVLGGARLYPSLARDDFTLAGYGSAYVRYVF